MKEFLRKNKIVVISFCLLIIIFFSYIYNVSAYTYESLDFKYGKVKTKTTLNIRCGPGMEYEKVGKLKNGEYVDVFAKVGEWYIVQTNANLVGAVSGKYIEPIYDESEVITQTSTNLNENISSIDEIEITKEEQEFLNLINSKRKNNGISELKIDKDIQNIARLKAEDLERNEYFSHESPSYGNIEQMLTSFEIAYIDVQENIAGNQNLSGAVEAWMNSESHKQNILNADFNYTGIAVVESDTYGKIFVEVFVKK